MTYIVSDCYYATDDNTVIHCMWLNPTLGLIPFAAVADDTTTYGPEIYASAIAGDYGPVLSYESTHYYSTDPATLGQIVIAPDGVQPPNTSTSAPLSPSAGATLYWYSGGWVSSYFDPNTYNTLSSAKTYLKGQTAIVAANAVDYQLRGYSEVQIRTAPDITALITFDYAPTTLGQYQTFIDGEVVARDAEVDSASALGQLFVFNPEELNTIYP